MWASRLGHWGRGEGTPGFGLELWPPTLGSHPATVVARLRMDGPESRVAKPEVGSRLVSDLWPEPDPQVPQSPRASTARFLECGWAPGYARACPRPAPITAASS